MKSFWTGSVTFGLVNIPIRLYSAVESGASVRFHYLHKKDLSPIRFARVCKEEGIEVPFADIVRGFEYERGQYVVVTDEELRKAAPEKTRTIEVLHFVDESEVDLIYAEQPYYLEPEKRAEKPYALLRHALKESGRVAVVRYVLRARENIGVIKPRGDALVLTQLRFADEIRDSAELNLPPANLVHKKEVDMALKLVTHLSDRFDPKAYKDTFSQELDALIKKKLAGKPLKRRAAAGTGESAKVYDLMAALQASLKNGGGKRTTKRRHAAA